MFKGNNEEQVNTTPWVESICYKRSRTALGAALVGLLGFGIYEIVNQSKSTSEAIAGSTVLGISGIYLISRLLNIIDSLVKGGVEKSCFSVFFCVSRKDSLPGAGNQLENPLINNA